MNIYEIIRTAVSRSPQLKSQAYQKNEDGLRQLEKTANAIWHDFKAHGEKSKFSEEEAILAGDVGTLCGYGVLYLTDSGQNKEHYLEMMARILASSP